MEHDSEEVKQGVQLLQVVELDYTLVFSTNNLEIVIDLQENA